MSAGGVNQKMFQIDLESGSGKKNTMGSDIILISTIIPTYNRAETVGYSIKSVLAQTHPVYEIIVIDDGSTDNTRQVVENIDSPKIKYLHQENRGGAGALNSGIHAALGNWIAILDSDDLWQKDKLEKQVELIRQNCAIDFVHTDRTLCWENGRTETRSARTLSEFTKKEFLFAYWATKQSTVLFRKSLAEKAGCVFREDLRTCYDYEFFWKLIFCARQVGYVTKPVVKIAMTNDGLSRTDSKINRTYDNIIAMSSVIDWMERRGERLGKFRQILAHRMIAEFRTIIEIRQVENSRGRISKELLHLSRITKGPAKREIAKVLIKKLRIWEKIR